MTKKPPASNAAPMVVLVLLLGILGFLEYRNHSGDKTPDPPKPMGAGDKAVLNSKEARCPVAVDESALSDLAEAENADDMMGLRELVANRRVHYVDNGTEVLILEHPFGSFKIRITSGVYSGQAGWIFESTAKQLGK